MIGEVFVETPDGLAYVSNMGRVWSVRASAYLKPRMLDLGKGLDWYVRWGGLWRNVNDLVRVLHGEDLDLFWTPPTSTEPPFGRRKYRGPVKDLDTGVIYKNMCAAAEALRISPSTVSMTVAGKIKKPRHRLGKETSWRS